jgi:hypothetical protein
MFWWIVTLLIIALLIIAFVLLRLISDRKRKEINGLTGPAHVFNNDENIQPKAAMQRSNIKQRLRTDIGQVEHGIKSVDTEINKGLADISNRLERLSTDISAIKSELVTINNQHAKQLEEIFSKQKQSMDIIKDWLGGNEKHPFLWTIQDRIDEVLKTLNESKTQLGEVTMNNSYNDRELAASGPIHPEEKQRKHSAPAEPKEDDWFSLKR